MTTTTTTTPTDLASRRRAMQMEAQRRFWAKVDKSGECWLWTGGLSNGYGRFHLSDGARKRAHRVAYEWLRGPIPPGLQLDHLCRVRNCVNPKHLEPVTSLENTRRGLGGDLRTHCPKGHPYGFTASGRRRCATCQRARGVKAWQEWCAAHPEQKRRLTPTQVFAIREAYANGATPTQLAAEYGVARSSIRRAAQGQSYAHLERAS